MEVGDLGADDVEAEVLKENIGLETVADAFEANEMLANGFGLDNSFLGATVDPVSWLPLLVFFVAAKILEAKGLGASDDSGNDIEAMFVPGSLATDSPPKLFLGKKFKCTDKNRSVVMRGESTEWNATATIAPRIY